MKTLSLMMSKTKKKLEVNLASHTYKQETQFWYTSPLISDKLGLPFDSYDLLLVSITLNISYLYCAKRYFVVVAPKKPFGWLLY